MDNLWQSNQNAVMNYQKFPFHLVTPSPWPFAISFCLIAIMISLAITIHGYISGIELVVFEVLLTLATLTLWLRDVIAEGTFIGDHTKAVTNGITIAFMLFSLSECLIFAGLFWAYIHSAISPTIELGQSWPPVGITAVNPMDLPLLNTILLLASGATVTWSHHAFINGRRSQALIGLGITTWLIIIFVLCQCVEYVTASFTISDGVYGSVFYAGTGLHFLHMIMLIIMLTVSYWRLRGFHITQTHAIGYEVTILYLHVLDVIWLALYIVFYWWGN